MAIVQGVDEKTRKDKRNQLKKANKALVQTKKTARRKNKRRKEHAS